MRKEARDDAEGPPVLRARLLTVSHYFETHRGGIEIIAGRLAQELSGAFDVLWLATGQARSSPPVHCRPLAATNAIERAAALPYPLLSPCALRAIFRAARESDAILVHDAIYMTSVAGFLASRVYRKPCVVVQHIGLVPYHSPLLSALMRAANRLLVELILAKADQVVFISETTRRYFASVDFRRAPLVFFNGVDASIFRPPLNKAEIAAARIDLDLPPDAPIALFVGRFVEKKGLAILERLARARPEILFVFAGWGALDPARWAPPNVRVFRELSGASLAPLYRAADLLLLPSVGEGFPLVVQEALACGLPVLCGAETAAADPDSTGLLDGVEIAPDPDDAARLFAEALTRALARGQDFEARAERAQFAARRYSWSAVGEDYRRLLEDLLENGRSAASSARQGQAA
jgi:glycosyltransferase involved in cell wall biosynthesis